MPKNKACNGNGPRQSHNKNRQITPPHPTSYQSFPARTQKKPNPIHQPPSHTQNSAILAFQALLFSQTLDPQRSATAAVSASSDNGTALSPSPKP